MELSVFFKSIIDRDTAPVVICDTEHTVVYMNPSSVARYHVNLTGKSLKACHNADSNKKIDEVNSVTAEQQREVDNIQKDKNKVDARTNEYAKLISNLQTLSETVAANSKTKNAIPTLLNQIMYVIPKNVQLTSIENTEGTHIVINAEAKQYEQLGYFKAILKTENILSNVVSDSAVKENGVVKVTIEGDII